jgi:uncharacterized protein YcbK (DUF882 family)
MMGDLSYHFSRKEFECKCGECEFNTVDAELISVLETIRARWNAPVIITSGVRCTDYNKEVGGSPNSMHLQSKAADIVVKGIDPHEVYEYLDWAYPDRYGVGNYDDFTHIDVRDREARF